MDQLRSIFEWIAARKYLSIVVVIVLISFLLFIRHWRHVSNGQISEPLTRGKIVDAVYGIGTVTPYKRFSFNPLVGTTVEKSFVIEGDSITKGKPLFQTENGMIYRAPFDGIVNYYPYRNGENTYATVPMMILTDMKDRYIVVSVEQQGALRVKPGQIAKISFDSLRQETFEGKVSAVYSYASNFLARVDSISLPETILPDMACDVAIVISVHENALLIPVTAYENGGVWVKRGHGLARLTPVRLGVTDGIWAEVLSGDVKPGDRVMIRKQVSQ
jgi:multidrug efflux pump subunit AcrA (membrane-fusion protein)